MKTKPKKLLSLLLSASMLCGMAMPGTAQGASAATQPETEITAEVIATPETAATAPRFSISAGAEGLDGADHINEDLFDLGDTEGEMNYGTPAPLLVQVDAPAAGASLTVTLEGSAVFADSGNAESTRTFENGEEAAAWLLYVQADGDFTATATYTDEDVEQSKTVSVTMQDAPMLFAETRETQYHITGVSKVGGEWLITFEGTDMSFCLDKGLDGQPTSSVYWTYYGTTDLLDKAAAAGCTTKLEIQRYVWDHRNEASDSGSAYVYAASQSGWQNIVTTFGSGGSPEPTPPGETPPPEETPPPTYDASWNVNVTESASAGFQVSMTVGVDKYANITQEKLSDAEITITADPNGGGLDGGNWNIDPASQIIRTVNGDGSVTFTYSGSVSKSASRSDSGSVSDYPSQDAADDAADAEKSEAEDRLRDEAKSDAQAQASAAANRVIRNWRAGKTTWIFADEFYLLFRYEYSANFFYKLWKRIRKYNGLITGLTQNVEELLRSDTARLMLANSEFLVMLNQSATDREELAKLLNISETQLGYITNVPAGSGLIRCAGNLVPMTNSFPRDTKLYKLMTTKRSEIPQSRCANFCDTAQE